MQCRFIYSPGQFPHSSRMRPTSEYHPILHVLVTKNPGVFGVGSLAMSETKKVFVVARSSKSVFRFWSSSPISMSKICI
jgi:hypothetical protein